MRESTTIYHPWRALSADWAHVRVDHTDQLPRGILADTNGIDHVRLRRRLYQVERRCTLAHELIHLERSDAGACPPTVEAEIDQEAARRLIPWHRLLEEVRWARSEEELADELWVTVRLLRARAETLRADELLELARATWAPE